MPPPRRAALRRPWLHLRSSPQGDRDPDCPSLLVWVFDYRYLLLVGGIIIAFGSVMCGAIFYENPASFADLVLPHVTARRTPSFNFGTCHPKIAEPLCQSQPMRQREDLLLKGILRYILNSSIVSEIESHQSYSLTSYLHYRRVDCMLQVASLCLCLIITVPLTMFLSSSSCFFLPLD